MAKDILLFGSIGQYNAMFFFDQIKEALKDDPEAELVIRINCEGGSPEYGLSMLEKIQEISEQVSIQVGSSAHSMALFALCYVDTAKVSCMDTTKAVLHRAAYPEWMESEPGFASSMYAELLSKTNKDLEKAFRAKVDVEALEALPQFKKNGIKLDAIFSMDSRIEVLLTSSDLKKVGLVSKVKKMIPAQVAAETSQLESFKKCVSLDEFKIAAQATTPPTPKENQEPKIKKIMTIEEIKAQFPKVVAEIKAEGVAEERDRVEAILVFNDVDPTACSAAVASGKSLTQKQMAEFNRKLMSKSDLKAIEEDSAEAVVTPAVKGEKPKTEKEVQLEKFDAEVSAHLKTKK